MQQSPKLPYVGALPTQRANIHSRTVAYQGSLPVGVFVLLICMVNTGLDESVRESPKLR